MKRSGICLTIREVSVRYALVVVLFLLLLQPDPSFGRFDPTFTWNTLESPHFLIHFHQGGEALAKRAATIAEDVHLRLAPRIKWEPKQKTHLILVDSADEANGEASPIPFNQMVLYITQPLGEPGFGATAYDEWLRLLITHEYTHVLHMDMVSSLPGVIQSIFGRIYFPNMFEPVWMIEGLATYEETSQTSGGRGRSPGAEMVLRMAALEGPFPGLSQATVYPDSWPRGQAPYLFGESFTRYISEKYGREKLAEISETYSGRWLPFLVSSTGKRVLGRSYDDLWDEWKDRLLERFRKQEQEVRTKGLTPSAALTRRGGINISPAFSPDGARIAYVVQNADEFPGIYVMNIDGSNDHKVIENTFSTSASGESLSWGPDNNRLYYTKLEVSDNSNLYNDIYYYDLKAEQEVRVTRGLRARDPHPSPDGKKLVFVANRMAMNRLGTVDLSPDQALPANPDTVTWLNEESANQYAAPRWSPDGAKLAVSVRQPDGAQDVWILDHDGRKIEELSHDRSLDGSPAWSPDGRYIYFSSDRTGIFNVYAYELATKKTTQVTNVLGGAFTPAPTPDGKSLVFSSYGARGYDLHSLGMAPADWKPVEPYADPYPVIYYDEKPAETTVRPYTALDTVYPRFWLPWLGYSQESGMLFGAITFGQDAIQRHRYIATALYGPRHERVWYTLDYYYDGLFPTLRLQASDTDATFSRLLQQGAWSADYVERERMVDLSLIVPFVKTAHQQSFTVGYRRRDTGHLTSLSTWPSYNGPIPAEGVFASGRLSYQFNNARQYGFSISPEQGRTVEVGYERIDKALGGDFAIRKYTADWHEYINFPWEHHVLQARAFAGSSSGEVLPQRAYQLGGDNPGDMTLSTDDQVVYLRGYPANAFRGSKSALAGLEYRFPVSNIEKGWDSKPVFLRRLHGAVFAEAGNAWDEAFHKSDLKRSVGAELRFDFYLAYYLPVTLRIVVADGLDENGLKQIYLGLWAPVEL